MIVTLRGNTENIYVAQLLGVLYRHAVVIFYPGETCPVTLNLVAEPFADTSWSPLQLITFAVQTVTQTHTFAFGSAMIIPESISSCTITVPPPKRASHIFSAHLQYKGSQLQVVVRKGETPKLVHQVPYPPELQLVVANGGFAWKGPAAAINLFLNALWKLLIVTL